MKNSQPVNQKKVQEPVIVLPDTFKKYLFSKPFYYTVALIVITFIGFSPVIRNDFLPTWDDEKYVTANPVVHELTADNLRLMFTRPVNATYVPLPQITYAIEYQLFGDNPMPFHVTSLLFHILSALLVFKILRVLRLDLSFSFFGAVLFAIHPMRVESVAWISERKDVMYAFFYLAAMYTYLQHIAGSYQNRKFLWYSILFFLCSLLSKIEAVTLPLSLLLLDYLLERPLRFKLLAEKIPYFILSLVFGVLGIIIIYRIGLHGSEILKSNTMIGFTGRLFYGLFAITGYMLRFFVPFSTSAIYPYPEMTGFMAVWIRFINPVVILLLGVLVVLSHRKTRAILFGVLFFLVNIIFLLQIVAVGNGFFADRYTYMAYFGLIFIVTWIGSEIVKRNPGRRTGVLTFFVICSAACLFITFSRSRIWKDGVSLWSHVIDQYPGKIMESYVNRGISYTMLHQWNPAIEDFSTALSIGPVSDGLYTDRGMVFGILGEPDKAIADFSKAIELNPANTKALYNRGVTYGNSNKVTEALHDFRRVASLEPENVSAMEGLSLMLVCSNNPDSARLVAEKGIKTDPYRANLYAILGNCELETGETAKAIDFFRHCLRIDDLNLDAYLGLSAAFTMQDDIKSAADNLELAKQSAQQQNIPLRNITDIANAGIILQGKKRAALEHLLAGKTR